MSWLPCVTPLPTGSRACSPGWWKREVWPWRHRWSSSSTALPVRASGAARSTRRSRRASALMKSSSRHTTRRVERCRVEGRDGRKWWLHSRGHTNWRSGFHDTAVACPPRRSWTLRREPGDRTDGRVRRHPARGAGGCRTKASGSGASARRRAGRDRARGRGVSTSSANGRRGAARRSARNGASRAAVDYRARTPQRAARPARRRGDLRRRRAGDVSRYGGPVAWSGGADDGGGEPSDPRAAAGCDRAPTQRQASDGAGACAGRYGSAHGRDLTDRRPVVGDRASVHGARRHARGVGRA